MLGLEIGGDDYLAKPFSVRELVARIRARLRRDAKGAGAGVVSCRFGRCELDLPRLLVKRDGEPVDLTSKEVSILALLVRAGGEVVSRDRILDDVWGDEAIDARRIDSHIVNLRRKLEDDPARPRFILSSYGEGCRFAG